MERKFCLYRVRIFSGLALALIFASFGALGSSSSPNAAIFDTTTNVLKIPTVRVDTNDYYDVELTWDGFSFAVTFAKAITFTTTQNFFSSSNNLLTIPVARVISKEAVISDYELTLFYREGKFLLGSITELALTSSLLPLVGPELNGSLTGLKEGDSAQITVISDKSITTKIVKGNAFSVSGLESGTYTIKFNGQGYKFSPTQKVTYTNSKLGNDLALNFSATELDTANFKYHWEEDVSVSGSEYSSYVNTPPELTVLGVVDPFFDTGAAITLSKDYKITLDNEYQIWSQEYAYRLLETLRKIPQEMVDPYNSATSLATSTRWVLVDYFLENDIKIQKSGTATTVFIAKEAFVYANPFLVRLDGDVGKFYSKRLFNALVRYITEDGADALAVEKILNEKFAVSTLISNYTELTESTTQENAASFQNFHPDELLNLIQAFEEMPDGMHKVTGLHSIARRLNGTTHPLYSTAPAVAWSESGYIEFMESAFQGDIGQGYLQRLIIHEKAHFLWSKLFSEQLRNDWIQLAGWKRDENGDWYTTKTTEFVSAYAHLKNPNEDMAESIAYYVVNPDKLRSRSLPKYKFIRDYIMSGTRYRSLIREDLTFQVYNLWPDYVYPGKIKSVDVSVTGELDHDKVLDVEIQLHALDLAEEGAKYAYMRIFSPQNTFVDMYLYPTDEANNYSGNSGGLGTTLKGRLRIERTAAKGYWAPRQISITDAVGNQRFEGRNDFGWKMYLNNPSEDLEAPSFTAGSTSMEIEPAGNVNYGGENYVGRELQLLTVTWGAEDNVGVTECFTRLVPDGNYSFRDAYGAYDFTTKTCVNKFYITEFYPSGYYSANMLRTSDAAGNNNYSYASEIDLGNNRILVTTNNPDSTPPSLDLNNISISGTPSNPDAPNGETYVNIVYYAKDDKSGLGKVSYTLRDPQGIDHFQYHYHDNFYSLYFDGDPAILKRYEINLVLPVGSAPGTWGLSSIYLQDKAGNFIKHDFTEIVRFDVNSTDS